MPLLLLLLTLSGASALVYQVVWQRMLSTVFGVTVFATSTVLACFMAGLALGSALGGRLADRVRRPLLLFAAAEAGIGLLALLTPAGLVLAEPFYAALRDRTGAGFLGLTAARLGCSFLLLLPPTTLMGATLPAVVAALPRSDRRLGVRVAALYGFNTLGAFAGALLAGYQLIGAFGLEATLRIAVAGNLVAALGAARLASRPGLEPPALAGAPGVAAGRTLSRRQGATLLAAFAVSGLVALGLEVVWFRMLLAYLPTTTYAFTTMLATVLAGIALGGLLAARPWPAEGELSRLGLLLAAAGAASVVSAAALAHTYAAGWRTSGLVQACIVALLPATTLMGMSYPRGLALWAGASSRVGYRAGAFAAFNLAGAILGALLAGFLLLPWLGTRAALLALSGLGVLAGATLLAVDARPLARMSLARLAVATTVFAAAAVFLPDPFLAALARRHKGETQLWHEEGAQATVAVHQDGQGRRVLYIDGMHQANDAPEMRTLHSRIGLLPLLLHGSPRRALVIGLAGGATPGALARDPDLSLQVVELAPAVVRASDFFRHINGDVLRRPNVSLTLDDGRNHLLFTRERYDLITADLVQPFHAGAGHLYSAEYFRLCRAALRDGGLMVQWIGHPPLEQYKPILRTFLEVFPEATLWSEAFLVGPRGPLRVTEAAFERAKQRPELAAALAEAGLAGIDSLLGLYTAGPKALRRFADGAPILTDDRPLVEYFRSLGRSTPLDLAPLGPADPSELLDP